MYGMKCKECFWCALNTAIGRDHVCCNKESKHYNSLLTESQINQDACDSAETEQAHDYKTLTPWQFASKYYM